MYQLWYIKVYKFLAAYIDTVLGNFVGDSTYNLRTENR